MRCFTNCAPHLPDSHDSHDNHDGMIVFKLHRPVCRTARPDAPSGSWQLPCSPGRALRSLAPRAGPGILFSFRAGVLGHAGPGIQGQVSAVEPPPVRKGFHRILGTGNWQLICDPNIKTAALHELCSAPPRLPFPDSRTMTGH